VFPNLSCSFGDAPQKQRYCTTLLIYFILKKKKKKLLFKLNEKGITSKCPWVEAIWRALLLS